MSLILASVFCLSSGTMPAAMEADFVTTRGTITAELDLVRAPMAVANLVTLAEGSRPWIDSRSGAVRNTPFYSGLEFHRVIDEPSQKIIETGSRTGGGQDGPGYSFRDEFDSALIHDPYVLTMANSGPNTNGSRICFTGNVGHPDRNGVHTVFGTVPGDASRAVIDAILAAGSGAASILSVQIRRTGPAAAAFDEHAVDLPVVTAIAPELKVTLGTRTEAVVDQPADSVLLAYDSANLSDWTLVHQNLVGLDAELPGPMQVIDEAGLPYNYYRFSLVEYPEVLGGSDFANRTLSIESTGTGRLVYVFDETGLGGTYQNIISDPILGEIVFFQGSFVVRDEIPPEFGPNSFSVLLYLFDEELGGSPFNHIRGGYDAVAPGAVTGRHVTTFLGPSMDPVFEDAGAMNLTRP